MSPHDALAIMWDPVETNLVPRGPGTRRAYIGIAAEAGGMLACHFDGDKDLLAAMLRQAFALLANPDDVAPTGRQ